MAKKRSFHSRYEREYLDRLAFSLVQFWPVGEPLPSVEAREAAIFYKVAIQRLEPEQRLALLRRLRRMATKASGVFDDDFRGTPACRELVERVIARFPELAAAETACVSAG